MSLSARPAEAPPTGGATTTTGRPAAGTAPERSGARACSVARTLDVVGEKWALLAIREAFLGCRRFDEMVQNTGAPRDTLATRLRTLVDHGVLERRLYCEHPPRYEYVLTESGRALYPVILTLLRWGDDYLAGPEGPPLVLVHDCGHDLKADVVCADCGSAVRARDVRVAGPARADRPADAPR